MRDGLHAVLGRLAALALVAAVTLAFVLDAGGDEPVAEKAPPVPAWEGLVPAHEAEIDVGQRVVVVLKAPSLSVRVAAAGGVASDVQERRWTRQALAAQQLFVSRMAAQGVALRPEFRFTRVLNGFSAAIDPRGVALLERAAEVEGIYPVRAAYPAGVSRRVVVPAALAGAPGALVALPSYTGRGVTVAVLDTGVDRAHPTLRGRVVDGVDVVGGSELALPAAPPGRPADVESHGTQLAGIVAAAGAPGDPRGVAPEASILPIRVAGWQRDARGGWAVSSRTDQLLAGLERAVDPNGDGDAHDAARIALLGAVEPFAGFADGPLARAALGALRLDTLVVSPAGNDGVAGPGFGFVSGPGGARAALAVGAADLRERQPRARVVLRTGLRLAYHAVLPLSGAVPPGEPLTLVPVRVEPTGGEDGAPAYTPEDFFDDEGYSRVAGAAAVLPAGPAGAPAARYAAVAGAAAVILHGSGVPAGGLGLDPRRPVPVVTVPTAAARALLDARRRGRSVGISIAAAPPAAGASLRRVAGFSSRGLAFDGRVKPDLVAPGVGVVTAEPGTNHDGSGRVGSLNGSSAAAAVAAGAAALLIQARPDLDADALAGALVGTARRLPQTPTAAQGGGLLDVEAAAAAELVLEPASLAFGRAARPDWRARRRVLVRNVSSRTVRARVTVRQLGFPAADTTVRVRPRRLILRPGAVARVRLDASVPRPAAAGPPAEGVLAVLPLAGRAVRAPWAIPFGPRRTALLGQVDLRPRRFPPSETSPAVLSLVAGRIRSAGGRDELEPLERLDVELWTTDDKRIGVIARLRNVLPGRYSFGITGRDTGGSALEPGEYRLRLLAIPAGGGPSTRRTVPFTIE